MFSNCIESNGFLEPSLGNLKNIRNKNWHFPNAD